MRRALLILSAIVLFAIHTQAGSLKSIPTDKNFPLNRQIVLNSKNIPAEENGQLSNIITRNGGTILYKFTVKKFVMPTISVKHADKIKGSTDKNAFRIDITQTAVKINYTTIESLRKAIESLKGLVTLDVYGNKCLRGGRYIWVPESNDTPKGPTSHMANEINQLLAELDKMPAGTETELILVTPTDWMIESPVLESVTGNKAIYSTANGYATCETLKEVIDKAQSRGILLKVIIWIHEENIPFKENLGHSIFSPEGMRFLRAAVQQWHDICGLQMLYTGSSDRQDTEMLRFNGFLEKLTTLTGTTVIYK